ncbi:hypothetical protein [Polyangium spumosum]|uniref:Bacterial virulence factor lipase N-terminal domain-containing protein n=1 Tax=Polyangium spumosum TaxID=889282 RepID=A0A6N7PEJ6_9BACT|nr:hypothetical protein [Polyangium spumosum]MRG90448.1 hypothetical protein [Polyangium spumosum]
MLHHARRSFFAFALLLAACGGEDTSSVAFTAPDRAADQRAPLTAPCGDPDELRCLLPWPSSAYLKADAATATGVRLHVEATSLPVADDPRSLALADGFSRVTPLVVGFPGPVVAPAATSADGPVRLLLAQPDHPRRGESVPLRLSTLPGEDTATETLLLAYPTRPLEPGADYVGVVLNDLTYEDGAAIAPTRQTQVALGLVEPDSQAEANLRGYHAPTRKLLADAGIDPARVLRVFDFTTRSGDDATKRLTAMREAAIDAVSQGKITVEIDSVVWTPNVSIAAIVRGRLVGLPSFLEDDFDLSLDAAGDVVESGTHEAPFRVMVPAGVGDYRFVMYGHGMGGDVDDSAFDTQLGQSGVGKVGIRFVGWTGDDLIETFVNLTRMAEATHRSTARLLQALADGAAIQRSMDTVLGELLSGPTFDGAANPLIDRKPDGSIPVWAGGSLGGTLGLVYASADPDMHHGVLNVPGAGWSHFIPGSDVYATVRGLLQTTYGGNLDVGYALALSQSNWDEVDGSSWADRMPEEPTAYLIQESIGDPILPNEGTALLSVAVGAGQVGAVLRPTAGIESSTEIVGKSGLTQYKVPSDDPYDIHGFAANGGPAGDAARAQITAYLKSVWDGQPTITVPEACTGGSCDFTK